MGQVRTLEDFIRQRMTVDGSRRMSITKRPDGLYEASFVHADSVTATCDADADPVTALWNALVPYTMRRRLPSGRDVVIEGVFLGASDQIDLEEAIAATPTIPSDLEDFL